MRLQQWAANGWLRPHQTTPSQIAIVERDIEDSDSDLSVDWQFGIAYNATLKLCTILLYASGFETTTRCSSPPDLRFLSISAFQLLPP